MKCDICQHERVCMMYKEYILKLERDGVQITVDNCKEFDEVK